MTAKNKFDNVFSELTVERGILEYNGNIIPFVFGSGVPDYSQDEMDKSIEGIDDDKNGIRDDVQRKIGIKYSDDDTIRGHSYALAYYYQITLLNPNNKEIQKDLVGYLTYHENCIGDSENGSRVVLPMMLNTFDRGFRYIKAMGSLANEALPEEQQCR